VRFTRSCLPAAAALALVATAAPACADSGLQDGATASAPVFDPMASGGPAAGDADPASGPDTTVAGATTVADSESRWTYRQTER